MLIYGGRSAEHDVSVVSARSIFNAISDGPYDITLVRIGLDGQWVLTGSSCAGPALAGFPAANAGGHEIALTHGGQIVPLEGGPATWPSVDVAFPVLHGTNGEDGTIQGLLALYDIPCVGAGVLASAAGMDKVCTKRLLRDAGIPVVDFRVARSTDVDPPDYSVCVEALGHPLFVKPANTGSSVGISKVRTEDEFKAAVECAFEFDAVILIESAVSAREIECSVLGADPVRVSVCGEIVTGHDFYTYEAKYLDEAATELIVPADLDEAQSDRIRKMARSVCKALECEGMARVDFFLEDSGTVYVNEINTIPGFTSVSMYPILWAHSGLPMDRLVGELLQDAIARHSSSRLLRRTR